MDPEVIAGIGNIYSDEILWEAKYNPLKPANKLSEKELRELWKAMHKILFKGFKTARNFCERLSRYCRKKRKIRGRTFGLSARRRKNV